MKESKRILIIDHEVDLCLLMKAYFLKKDYQVFISHNIYDAISCVKDFRPNAIFLASATCQNPEDMKKLKELAPDAEIIIDSYDKAGEV